MALMSQFWYFMKDDGSYRKHLNGGELPCKRMTASNAVTAIWVKHCQAEILIYISCFVKTIQYTYVLRTYPIGQHEIEKRYTWCSKR